MAEETQQSTQDAKLLWAVVAIIVTILLAVFWYLKKLDGIWAFVIGLIAVVGCVLGYKYLQPQKKQITVKKVVKISKEDAEEYLLDLYYIKGKVGDVDNTINAVAEYRNATEHKEDVDTPVIHFYFEDSSLNYNGKRDKWDVVIRAELDDYYKKLKKLSEKKDYHYFEALKGLHYSEYKNIPEGKREEIVRIMVRGFASKSSSNFVYELDESGKLSRKLEYNDEEDKEDEKK